MRRRSTIVTSAIPKKKILAYWTADISDQVQDLVGNTQLTSYTAFSYSTYKSKYEFPNVSGIKSYHGEGFRDTSESFSNVYYPMVLIKAEKPFSINEILREYGALEICWRNLDYQYWSTPQPMSTVHLSTSNTVNYTSTTGNVLSVKLYNRVPDRIGITATSILQAIASRNWEIARFSVNNYRFRIEYDNDSVVWKVWINEEFSYGKKFTTEQMSYKNLFSSIIFMRVKNALRFARYYSVFCFAAIKSAFSSIETFIYFRRVLSEV